jgi:hypothetical protein
MKSTFRIAATGYGRFDLMSAPLRVAWGAKAGRDHPVECDVA